MIEAPPSRARPPRGGRALALAIIVTTAIAITVPWLTRTGVAQQSSELSMTLNDQNFTVAGGDTISLSYDLDGALPRAVLPTTTTTSTATTTTTTPAPPSGQRAAGIPPAGNAAAAPPDAPATTSAPVTTTPPPPPVDGKLRVLVYPRLTEQDQIATALAGDLPSDPSDGVELELTDQLTVNRSSPRRPVSLDIDVPVADGVSGQDDLNLAEPGVYPVKAQIRLDGDAVAEHITLVRRVDADTTPPLRLGVMAGAPSDDTDVLNDMVALGEVDLPLTVAIPPDVLAATKSRHRRLFGDLAAALRGDEAVAMPSDGLDASSAATAELDALFGQHVHDGETATIRLLPETPVRRTVWPLADNDLSEAGADLVVGLGVRMFVVAPWVSELDIENPPPIGRQALVDLPDGDAGALTIDPAIARLVSSPPDGRTPIDQAVRALSRLMLNPDVSSSRGVVLATEDLSVPDARVIDAIRQLVEGSDEVSFAPVSSLPGLAPIDRTSTVDLPEEAGMDLRPRVSRVNMVRLTLANTASMLMDDGDTQSEWNNRLDALLTTNIDDEEAEEVLGKLTAESNAIRGAVQPPDPFTFTLTGRRSEILVPIGNDSERPLRVEVVPSSPKLNFPDGAVTVQLQPDATTSVPIDVVARSNGRSSVAITVQTPSDEPLMPAVFLTANVTSLTGLSQLVTGGAILVLLTWWFSHLRQRRRQRRLAIAQGRHPATTMVGNVSPDAAEAADTDVDDETPP